MPLHVLLEVALLCKHLAAKPADVWGSLAVSVRMSFQLQLIVESLAAGKAGELLAPAGAVSDGVGV